MSETPTKYCFKVIAGSHIDENGTHEIGALIFTDQNLAAKFGHNKFRLVVDDLPAASANSPPKLSNELETLTVPQLRKLAKDRGVDLTDTNGKEEIVNAIRLAMDVA